MSSHVETVRGPDSDLNPRQQQTVERLLDAGAEELRAVGADGVDTVTVRSVAARAGVAPATAYTYFASRDHLLSQLFLRHLQAHPAPAPTADAGESLRATVRAMATMLADSPEMAAAATRALLGNDPAVEQVRNRIGLEFYARFRAVLGPDADPAVLDTLTLTWSGALLQAGMGAFTYTAMADRLDAVLAVILKGAA